MPLLRLPRRRDVLAGAVGAAVASSVVRAQARRGGTLRVSVEQAPAKLNPLQHRVGAEYLLGELLYSGLTRLGPDMAAEPDLAVSWAANPALTEWTFKLRPDVMFHDGSPMTARDVAATFAAILDPATGSPARSNIGPVERVTALDDMTVLVTLKGAYADLPVALAYTNAKIRRGSESGLFGLHRARGNRRFAGAGFWWEGCLVREAASRPGSSSLGPKRSQA